MTAITAGQGATISASTAEGQVFQLIQWWQLQEINGAINPLEQEFFTGSKNTDTNFFEGTWKLPIAFVADSPAQLSATQIYQNLIFNPGTGGTIGGETAEKYTLELMLLIMNKQKDGDINRDKNIYITGDVNLNEGMVEGNFKIPFTTTLLANGGTQDVAREYLI